MSKFFEINLPKWPQMLVTGKPVTVDQAKEIIFRTDDFLTDTSEYSGGNNRDFNAMYRSDAGLNRFEVKYTHGLEGEAAKEEQKKREKAWRFSRVVRERADIINTQYVSNSWASSSFVFGGHGWCSPQGEIYYVDNVGKWPSVEDVTQDWEVLAREFPFLNLTATLMSGESGDEESKPLVNIVVADGKVTLEEGDVSVHSKLVPHKRNFDDIGAFLGDSRKELGLPTHWYGEMAARVRAIVDSITEEDLSFSDNKLGM